MNDHCCNLGAQRAGHELQKALALRSASGEPRIINVEHNLMLMACRHCDDPVWVPFRVARGSIAVSVLCDFCANHCHQCGKEIDFEDFNERGDIDEHGLPVCRDCWGYSEEDLYGYEDPD